MNDCLRIWGGYNRGFRQNSSDDEGMEEAQKALAPRGGGRTGLSTAEVRNRLFVLSAHLLSTVSKLGIELPFGKLFTTVKRPGSVDADDAVQCGGHGGGAGVGDVGRTAAGYAVV